MLHAPRPSAFARVGGSEERVLGSHVVVVAAWARADLEGPPLLAWLPIAQRVPGRRVCLKAGWRLIRWEAAATTYPA